MSILFARISNPFSKPRPSQPKSHHNNRPRSRPGFIDPSVVKTWHWNYCGEFFVIKFRTDTMQIWVNDAEVPFSPSFNKNEGLVDFEAGHQKCQIRVCLAKGGASDCKHWANVSGDEDENENADEKLAINDRTRDRLERPSSKGNRPKLLYKLFVEGVSLGLPDSLEALMQRATSAVVSTAKTATKMTTSNRSSNDQRNTLLPSSNSEAEFQSNSKCRWSKAQQKQQKSTAGRRDPRDAESMSGDLQSLLVIA